MTDASILACLAVTPFFIVVIVSLVIVVAILKKPEQVKHDSTAWAINHSGEMVEIDFDNKVFKTTVDDETFQGKGKKAIQLALKDKWESKSVDFDERAEEVKRELK